MFVLRMSAGTWKLIAQKGKKYQYLQRNKGGHETQSLFRDMLIAGRRPVLKGYILNMCATTSGNNITMNFVVSFEITSQPC